MLKNEERKKRRRIIPAGACSKEAEKAFFDSSFCCVCDC